MAYDYGIGWRWSIASSWLSRDDSNYDTTNGYWALRRWLTAKHIEIWRKWGVICGHRGTRQNSLNMEPQVRKWDSWPSVWAFPFILSLMVPIASIKCTGARLFRTWRYAASGVSVAGWEDCDRLWKPGIRGMTRRILLENAKKAVAERLELELLQ